MNTKRLIITGIVGSISLAVLGLSFSFAWYSSGENLYLDTVVINISGSRELLISDKPDVDTLTDRLYFSYDEEDSRLPGTSLFKPVSSMFKENWLNEKASDPDLYEYKSALVDSSHAPAPEIAEWGFYSQHLYLWCNTDTSVTIDSAEDALYIEPIIQRNEKYAEEIIDTKAVQDRYASEHPDYTREQIKEDIIKRLEELTKCMRIGILDLDENDYKFGIVDPYKEEETLLGGREDLFLAKYYDYYINSKDHEKYEILYGDVNDRSLAVYDEASDVDSPAPKEYTSFNSRTKANVHPFNLEKSIENGLVIKQEDSLSREELEEGFTMNLPKQQLKEFVLVIYMEGWDLDCNNYHMGGSFNVNLKFRVAENLDQ